MSDIIVVTMPSSVDVVETDGVQDVLVVPTEGSVNVVTTEGVGTTVIKTEEAVPVIFSFVSVGPQGPRGEAGGDVVSYIADETISGHRVVILDDNVISLADCNTIGHGNRVVGITTGAIVEGAVGDVRRSGIMTEPSWSWNSNNPIWLGNNGLLVQTAPTSGFNLIVGFPVSSTKIMVWIREPIFLI